MESDSSVTVATEGTSRNITDGNKSKINQQSGNKDQEAGMSKIKTNHQVPCENDTSVTLIERPYWLVNTSSSKHNKSHELSQQDPMIELFMNLNLLTFSLMSWNPSRSYYPLKEEGKMAHIEAMRILVIVDSEIVQQYKNRNNKFISEWNNSKSEALAMADDRKAEELLADAISTVKRLQMEHENLKLRIIIPLRGTELFYGRVIRGLKRILYSMRMSCALKQEVQCFKGQVLCDQITELLLCIKEMHLYPELGLNFQIRNDYSPLGILPDTTKSEYCKNNSETHTTSSTLKQKDLENTGSHFPDHSELVRYCNIKNNKFHK